MVNNKMQSDSSPEPVKIANPVSSDPFLKPGSAFTRKTLYPSAKTESGSVPASKSSPGAVQDTVATELVVPQGLPAQEKKPVKLSGAKVSQQTASSPAQGNPANSSPVQAGAESRQGAWALGSTAAAPQIAQKTTRVQKNEPKTFVNEQRQKEKGNPSQAIQSENTSFLSKHSFAISMLVLSGSVIALSLVLIYRQGNAGTAATPVSPRQPVVSSQETASVPQTKLTPQPVTAVESPVPNQPARVSSLVDLNTASFDELVRVNGIGEKTASRIIENRPYSDPSELKKIPGIGAKRYELFKAYVTVKKKN